MVLTVEEAALILGDTPENIRDMQQRGVMPDPIPDELLEPVVQFRLDLQKSLLRKLQERQLDDSQHRPEQ